MKIMYVDASTDGHHLTYLNYLLQAVPGDSFAVLPQDTDKVKGRARKISAAGTRSFQEYGNWMKELRGIAEEERPEPFGIFPQITMSKPLSSLYPFSLKAHTTPSG